MADVIDGLGRLMTNFIKDIFKVSFSNVISMISGILVGFLVPKIMGLEGYANFKIYTLYLTYIALLSLGFGDGIYLKFTGMNKSELNNTKISNYLKIYYCQLFTFFVLFSTFSVGFISAEYRFIAIALSITVISSQVTAVHQNLSIITSNFNEYTIRVVTKSSLTAAFVVILFFIYRYTGHEVSYKIYVAGVVLIEILLTIWYVFTYRELNFRKVLKGYFFREYLGILLLGMPLLLSNMAGTIFLNLDRQFVAILFEKETYAVYAFAYNMLHIITTMTSAISLVLFPSLKKMENLDVTNFLNKYLPILNSVIGVCLIVYFPLCWLIPVFLPKYVLSLDIFRIVLPGLVISTSVSVILINIYKMEGKINIYFVNTIIAMVLSVATNYLAYKIFGTYQSISWASIFTLFIWYIMELRFFICRYHIKYIKNCAFIGIIGAGFYFITYYFNDLIIGGIVYLSFFTFVFVLLNGTSIAAIIKNRR